MKMKSMLPILLGLAMMGDNERRSVWRDEETPMTDAEKAEIERKNKRKIALNNGLKEFIIDNKVYYAINYRTALKKSKKDE